MRREGSIRQRSPGSFEVRYSLGTDAATGRRKTATATVRGDRKDAEKELRRLLRSLDTGEHVDPTRMTVRQWLTAWLDTIQQEVARRSHDRYASILHHHLIPRSATCRSRSSLRPISKASIMASPPGGG